jgi:4-oxalomesaconate tautomerase
MDTPDGEASAQGRARIDGVPGTSAPIDIAFSMPRARSAAPAADRQRRRRGRGRPCTLIDNGMPVIVLRAADVGRTGYEPREQLDKDTELKARIERIRLAAGPLMNLGDVSQKVVPKIALVAPPQAGGAICTRSFIPHECHASIGVFAAVTVATAARCRVRRRPRSRHAAGPRARSRSSIRPASSP